MAVGLPGNAGETTLLHFEVGEAVEWLAKTMTTSQMAGSA
jgi:hypothetical protein